MGCPFVESFECYVFFFVLGWDDNNTLHSESNNRLKLLSLFYSKSQDLLVYTYYSDVIVPKPSTKLASWFKWSAVNKPRDPSVDKMAEYVNCAIFNILQLLTFSNGQLQHPISQNLIGMKKPFMYVLTYEENICNIEKWAIIK